VVRYPKQFNFVVDIGPVCGKLIHNGYELIGNDPANRTYQNDRQQQHDQNRRYATKAALLQAIHRRCEQKSEHHRQS
jgi:hypothetical protein